MKKEWLNETLRDIIALGGIPFFILVLIRVSILGNISYLLEFLIAGILFLICYFIFKPDIHSGLSLIILILLSNYYNEIRFTILSTIAYFGLIWALIYLKKNKREIFQGIIMGALSTIIGYFLVNNFFN